MKNPFNTFLFLYACIYISAIQTYQETIPYPEKKIVITIPSYNNKNYYQKNLESVLSQNYSNFKVLYVDDCSSDGTGDLVAEFLQDNDPQQKVSLIKNKHRKGALHNLYTMIYSCDDDAIIVTLDGDDWLADNEVLSRLNNTYSSDEIWLTYGQFKMHSSNTIGWASAMPDYVVQDNIFREFQHLPTHLRTFYAWLFKQIKTHDLLYLGNFYPMAWDMAMMFPMIEMAGERHKFIPEIMYIYNDENNISDHHISRQLQAHLAQTVKRKKRYKRLTNSPINSSEKNTQKADVIIFASTPALLKQFIDSLYIHVQGIETIFVMYKQTNKAEQYDYEQIQSIYPEIRFYSFNNHAHNNFKNTLTALYNQSQSNYILFSKSDVCFRKPVSLFNCINLLEEIPAYAFYFSLNAHDGINAYQNLRIIECRNNIFVWNFSLAREEWSSANSLNLVLHKKADPLRYILQGHYNLTPNGLETIWANEGRLNRLGVCFEESHVTTII